MTVISLVIHENIWRR